MGGTKNNHLERGNIDPQKGQIWYVFSYMWI